MRFFIDISYKGTAYHGWQKQQNAHSVQEEIEKAMQVILRQEIGIIGSGRTDTGVHAKQQFAHFDFDGDLRKQNFISKMNAVLPKDISLNRIFLVKDDAHARFDAFRRSYQYWISSSPEPFRRELAYYFYRNPDVVAMNQAAKLFLGKHDFQAFSKVKANVNHYICEVWRAEWQLEDGFLVFHVSANRFLHGMVRAMVGTLLEVGLGKLSLDELKQILEAKDRRNAGRAAPPEGLFLSEVAYPEQIFIE